MGTHEPATDLLSRIIAEHVRDGIILMDPQGFVVWTNPAFTRLSGYDIEDLRGKRPADVMRGSETSKKSQDALARAADERTACKVDVVNYSKAGELYVAEVQFSPIVDSEGRLLHFVEIQRDVSEERALKQESVDFKAYQRALDLQAIVSVTDARGKITFVNPKFSEISGYSADELIGQTHRIVNSGHHEKSFFFNMWKTIRGGDTWHAEVCNRNKAGEPYWVDTTVVPVLGPSGEILRYVSTRYDITERKRSEHELQRLALTDGLTGLVNRARFLSLMKEILEADDNAVLVVMIDLDHFKDLNDSRGHFIGDLLLKETAKRLVDFVGPHGTVARLGGDEFAAIINADGIAQDPQDFVQDLHSAASDVMSLEGKIYTPSFSMGVAQYPKDAETPEKLLINADFALYDAKGHGRNTWRFFDPAVRKRLDHRDHLKAVVKESLDKDAYTIALQPLCHGRAREHAGFEVLARLIHDGKPVPPDQFIPIAQENGLIPEIGRKILEKSFSFFHDMKKQGLEPGPLSVNVAAPQFREPGFIEDIQDLLLLNGMVPSDLIIEITETSLIGRSTEVVATSLRSLREIGVRIALDDFGTGFSSLSHLRDFSVDMIKIDKSFVQDLETSLRDRGLVKGLIELAHCLDLRVVAEGVETSAQFDQITDFGADFVQGYFHARPLSVPEAELFLQETTKPAKDTGVCL